MSGCVFAPVSSSGRFRRGRGFGDADRRPKRAVVEKRRSTRADARGRRAVARPIVLRSGQQSGRRRTSASSDGNELIVRTSLAEGALPVSHQPGGLTSTFGGGADVPVRFRGAQHAIVLRDGASSPQVADRPHYQEDPKVAVSGSRSERRTARAPVPGSRSGAAVFRRTRSDGDGAAGQPPRGAIGTIGSDTPREVDVPARQRWTPTAWMVPWRASRLPIDGANPLECGRPHGVARWLRGQNNPALPPPQVFSGALIGRIGKRRPSAIGGQTGKQMPGVRPVRAGDQRFRAERQRRQLPRRGR